MNGARAISLHEARALVLEAASPLAPRPFEIEKALGLHLAADVVADEPLQSFDNSAMDGYAVRAGDLEAASEHAPVALAVVGESRAGRPAEVTVGPGEAIAISTGAMLPTSADAVVRIEDTRSADDRVEVLAAPSLGANIRRAGEDVAAGETVLESGAELGPGALGLLVALGVERVSAHPPPSVAIVTSGDELTAGGEPLEPGRVRDSNGPMLAALVASVGARVHSVGRTVDSLEATVAALEPALDADVLIACGGVSIGEHDHVKEAFAELGAAESFWRVALKPGGPTWFGSRNRTLVFGLPGNPVSAFVTFTLLAAPALARLAGGEATRRLTTAALAAPYEKRTGRTEAIRCSLELTEQGWRATPQPHQGSHVLTSLLGADALALIPAEAEHLEAGDRVEVELLEGGCAPRGRSIGS